MTLAEQLNVARQHHQRGNLPEAKKLYQQILARQPSNAESLQGLGLIAHQQGKGEEAVELIRKAIAVSPKAARFHLNLGTVLDEMGKTEEAIAAYRKAISLKPNYAGALSNLGRALTNKKQVQEAISVCKQAIAFDPNLAEAHQNLGGALFQAGSHKEAVAALRQAAALRPDSAKVHTELGSALLESGQREEAITILRRAIAILPNYPEAHNNLGAAFLEQRKFEEAIAEFKFATTVNPKFVDAFNNLGNALRLQGRLDESLEALRQGLAVQPQSVETLTSMGSTHYTKGQYDRAMMYYRLALVNQADHETANWNLALALLLKGDFERGWPLYHWRWKLKEFRGRTYPSTPLWDGSDLNGKRILLHAEQGFGDAIQFIRYLPLVAGRGGRVLMACHVELHRLFKEMDQPVKQWVAPNQPLPEHDIHCPLMSLPMVLKTTIATIPARVPYLKAGNKAAERWKERLAPHAGLKVGLVWAGRPTHPGERERSIGLKQLAALGQVSGVNFVSLQKGEASAQTKDAPLPMLDWTEELEDFADTAALLANLDLVICVDTAVAHLAGAMGKPVWVLTPFVPDYRWMLDREDSPWYPTMRLFRQPKLGEWTTPIERVVKELHEYPRGA